MPIRRETTDSAIDEYIEKLVDRKTKALIRDYCYIGEQCVNHARIHGNYGNPTGNLRSSIGYVVVMDGEIVQMSSFESIFDGQKGSVDGKAFALQIASRFPKGICLIVVAGMKYASSVSGRGKDVLDSSELLAEQLVPKMLRKLGIKFK